LGFGFKVFSLRFRVWGFWFEVLGFIPTRGLLKNSIFKVFAIFNPLILLGALFTESNYSTAPKSGWILPILDFDFFGFWILSRLVGMRFWILSFAVSRFTFHV
jgi:hypothetical protein